ncbi:3-isopropylmalate dehydrogenase [Candidatus Binatia bacterium]|nr:3-isopropylmalate dehydrogenase [Candidatus Binatia bacterium]
MPCVTTTPRVARAPHRIGVLPGEGSGPEIVRVALDVLDAVSRATGLPFDVRFGGAIGIDAERESGVALTDEVASFCEETFAAGGAVLAGAGGGRFVYDLRRRFDLFCKLNPIRTWRALDDVTRLRCRRPDAVDVLIVRDNVGGVYYSTWSREVVDGGIRLAQQTIHLEPEVRRLMDVAARMAALRRGHLAVVVKHGGLPELSALWEAAARDAAAVHGVEPLALDVDLAAYRLVQEPESLDVVVAPNLFADVLSDLGGVIAGSRALTFGGSYGADRAAVYQTNHGSAHDLARTDRANPAGQVLALAMLLRESFGLAREAELIEAALDNVWARGIRTADVAGPGSRGVGSREFGRCLTAAVQVGARARLPESA